MIENNFGGLASSEQAFIAAFSTALFHRTIFTKPHCAYPTIDLGGCFY
jgi:hypothetical protein